MIHFSIKDGLLNNVKFTKEDNHLILPDEVTGLDYQPFLPVTEPFTLTLSPNMKTSFTEMLSESITVLNIPAGTEFTCSDCAPNYSPFFCFLREINVSPENESCSSFNGMLLSKDGTILYACPADHQGPITVPDSVTKINDRAFYGCDQIKEITLPPSIVEIGERAFADCKSLTSINIPNSVTTFGREIFLRCNKLLSAGPVSASSKETSEEKAGKKTKKEYNLEFAFTSVIPDYMFEGMRKLKKVVLPDTIQKLGKNSFKDCKSLEEITMPETLTFDAKLFKDCKKLSVQTTASKEFIIQGGFLNRYQGTATEVTVPDEVTIIGQEAFARTNVTSVILPPTITTLESGAFLASKIEHITLNSKPQKIGACAFSPHSLSLGKCIYPHLAISNFSKADHYFVAKSFVEHSKEWDYEEDVYKQNISFFGKNLLEKAMYSTTFCDLLMADMNLFHEFLSHQAIPLSDIDNVIAHFSNQKNTDLLAELLQYKDTLFNTEKGQKWLAKEEEKAEAALFADASEMSVADARKLYKFKYKDGAVVITGCYTKEQSWVVPAKIGKREVKTLERDAFGGRDILTLAEYNCTKNLPNKKTVVISEGVSELCPGAFTCINNMEIYLPTTITSIPTCAFQLVSNLRIHIPDSVTVLEDDCIYPYLKAKVTVIAPIGSCAEAYVKEHPSDLDFEAETL